MRRPPSGEARAHLRCARPSLDRDLSRIRDDGPHGRRPRGLPRRVAAQGRGGHHAHARPCGRAPCAMHGRGRGLGLLHAMARRLEHDRDRASLCGLVPGGRSLCGRGPQRGLGRGGTLRKEAFGIRRAPQSGGARGLRCRDRRLGRRCTRALARGGRRSDGALRGAVVFGSLVPLVCAVPSRGRLLPAACGFISIAAGAVLLQWTVQCLGLPAWQFFAR